MARSPLISVSFELTEAQYDALKDLAELSGKDESLMVRHAIDDYIKRQFIVYSSRAVD